MCTHPRREDGGTSKDIGERKATGGGRSCTAAEATVRNTYTINGIQNYKEPLMTNVRKIP